MISRRVLLGVALSSLPVPAWAAIRRFDGLEERFAQIEAASGGRLGIAVRDTGSGAQAGHRADERFPLCSTFKLLAAASVLTRIDAGQERPDRVVAYGERDLVPYSPVTKARLDEGGLPLSTLCEAAITQSDNTAGNLLLAAIGGPPGFTAFARSLGDTLTRLDRTEPDLNEAIPGDPRDTTSPAAMLADLERLLVGDHLSQASRTQLNGWLEANRTGGTRLRAGLPGDWRVGDKTGSGDQGTTNDIAILTPPGAKPLLVTVYLTQTSLPVEARNRTIAEVARAIAA